MISFKTKLKAKDNCDKPTKHIMKQNFPFKKISCYVYKYKFNIK